MAVVGKSLRRALHFSDSRRRGSWSTWSRLIIVGVYAATMSLALRAAASPSTTALWLDAVDGNWGDATYWSTSVYPNNGTPNPEDTYDVLIDAAGSPYTVTLKVDSTVDSLTLASVDATVKTQYSGELTVLGAFDLQAGTFLLDGGTIHGGIITSSGGTLETAYPRNGVAILDGVTLDTDLTMNERGSVTAVNGLTLENGHCIWMTSEDVYYVNYLSFDGTQMLGGTGDVVLQSSSQKIYAYPDSTLTIGSDITVRTGTGSGRFVPDTNNALVNHGLISAQTADEYVRIETTSFENHGTVEATSGGQIILDGNWTNAGTLRVDNGTLDLGGSFSHTDIGTLDYTSGVVRVTGTMDNAGNTFLVDNSTGSVHLYQGTIVGGAIDCADGQKMIVTASGNFDGVTLRGDLVMPGPGYDEATLRVYNGLTLDNGAIDILDGEGADILFYGSQALGGQGTISLNGHSSRISAWTGTLTIGPDVLIENTSPNGDLGYADFGLVSNGLVRVNEGHLDVGGAYWVNNGTIEMQPDTYLSLKGSVRTADIGTIVNNGGTIYVSGTIDNTGDSFDMQSTLGTFKLNGGTFKGGTLVGSSPAQLVIVNSSSLDGVTLDVDLQLPHSEYLYVWNGLTLNNRDIELTCGADLLFRGVAALGGTGGLIVHSRPASSNYSTDISGDGLVIGSGITIRHGDDNGGSYAFRIDGDGWVNQGTIVVDGGDATLRGDYWMNQGLVQVNNGSLLMNGKYTTAAIGTIQRTGGTISIGGTLENDGDTLTLDASTGSWYCEATIKGGTISTTDGQELIVSDFDQARLEGVALAGDVRLKRSAELRIIDDSILDGVTIRMEGHTDFAAPTAVFVNTPGNLLGNATIVFDGPGTHNLFYLYNSDELILGSSITVCTGTGSGVVSGDPDLPLVNEGIIHAGTSGEQIRIQPEFSNSGSLFANSGSLQADHGGKLIIRSDDCVNSGTMQLADGTIEIWGNAFTNATTGVVEGNGIIDVTQTIFENAGAISPEGPGGLSFIGDFAQTSDGTILIDVKNAGENGFDLVQVAGDALLSGAVSVELMPGALFVAGDRFEFLSAASIEGEFEEQFLPTLGDGSPIFAVDYQPDCVALVALQSVPEPSTWPLLTIGLMVLLSRARRTKK